MYALDGARSTWEFRRARRAIQFFVAALQYSFWYSPVTEAYAVYFPPACGTRFASFHGRILQNYAVTLGKEKTLVRESIYSSGDVPICKLSSLQRRRNAAPVLSFVRSTMRTKTDRDKIRHAEFTIHSQWHATSESA